MLIRRRRSVFRPSGFGATSRLDRILLRGAIMTLTIVPSGVGSNAFAGRLPGFGCRRLAMYRQPHQPVAVFGLLVAKHSRKFLQIAPAIGGELVATPPDFFKNIVLHKNCSLGRGVSFLTNRLGGLAWCERHQPFRMLRFKGLQAFEQTTDVVATFRGDFVANPPDFFEDFVFHTV